MSIDGVYDMSKDLRVDMIFWTQVPENAQGAPDDG